MYILFISPDGGMHVWTADKFEIERPPHFWRQFCLDRREVQRVAREWRAVRIEKP